MSTLAQPAARDSSRPPLDAQNPWPGLDSFRETDQQFFRGRAQEAIELLRLVERARIAVLYGVSGIGKSSLLEAGLFPLLRGHGMLPIRIRLDFSNEEWDLVSQVKHAISTQAAAARIEAPVPSELETLWEYFHRRERSFWDERNRLVMPVLVIDQFEELFTLGGGELQITPRVRDFVVQLADLAEGRAPEVLQEWLKEHPEDASKFIFSRHHYRIVIGMREDFLAQFDDFRDIMPSIAANRKRLLPMDGEAGLEVVNQAPQLISPEVAEQVVRFVGKAEDPQRDLSGVVVDPALLSVVCTELNEKRRKRGDAMISAGLLEGSREEILRDFYERAMKDVSAATRAFIEERLILDPGYRDTVALDVALRIPGVTRSDIDTLVRRRLVRIEQRGAVRRVELTHDLLVGVVLDSRNRRHVEEKAEQQKTARIEAEQRERAARRSLRRTRMLAGVLVLLFLAATGAAVLAYLAEKRATQNRLIAETSVDDLTGLAAQSEETASEAPETLLFRERLLDKAQDIYRSFHGRDQSSEDLRWATAMGHFRRGDLERLRGDTNQAIAEYQTAIQQLDGLVREFKNNPQYRKALSDAYNWLGETERPFPLLEAGAEKAYNQAIDLRAGLQREFPKNSDYRQALAQSYNNRGILRENAGQYDNADTDYHKSIALLAPATNTGRGSAELTDPYRHDLARAKNNLALLISKTKRPGDARSLSDQAIEIGEALVKHNPDNREYNFELAEYLNNSAILLQSGDPVLAKQRNARAIEVITQLGEPPPYLKIQLALLHNTRGRLATEERDAQAEYQLAIKTFESVPNDSRNRYFHVSFGQALANLAEVSTVPKQAAVQLLLEAIHEQKAGGSNMNLAWDYYFLALAYQDIRSFDKMRQAIDSSRSLLPDLPETQRRQLADLLNDITRSKR